MPRGSRGVFVADRVAGDADDGVIANIVVRKVGGSILQVAKSISQARAFTLSMRECELTG